MIDYKEFARLEGSLCYLNAHDPKEFKRVLRSLLKIKEHPDFDESKVIDIDVKLDPTRHRAATTIFGQTMDELQRHES